MAIMLRYEAIGSRATQVHVVIPRFLARRFR